MTEEISHIGNTEICKIAREVFGSSAAVDLVKEIRPSEGANPRIIGCNWNLSSDCSAACIGIHPLNKTRKLGLIGLN